MAEYKKYMFDNFVVGERKKKSAPAVVDAIFVEDTSEVELVEETVVEAEPLVEVKTYLEEELSSAVRSAEEKGYERGFGAALTDNDKIQTMLLDNINNRLMTILADVNTQCTQQEQNALRFAVSLVRKLLPSLEEEVAVSEVESFIRDNFKNFSKEASLSFSFHPDMIGVIAPQISKLAEKNDFEGKIAIHKDESLGLSDCKVEWKNGHVERNSAHTLTQVENLLES